MSEGDLLAVWLTLKLAASTTAILLLLSPPLAWWLSRSQHRLRPLVEALVAWLKGPGQGQIKAAGYALPQ